MVRCLLHLYSPSYLLSGLAALVALYPGRRVSSTVLIQVPGASEAIAREIKLVVDELASGHPSVESIAVLSDDKLAALALPYNRDRTAQRLHTLLGSRFDDLLYAHDGLGAICRLLGIAYPDARRVCIGDAFGMIYDAEFLAGYAKVGSFWRRTARKVHSRLGKLRPFRKPASRLADLGRRLPSLAPHVAALVLPVDPSGQGLRGVDLRCCDRDAFIEQIRFCHANARSLSTYESKLVEGAPDSHRYLLLTETYAEAGLMQPDREIAMYAEIIRTHCKSDSVVFLKPHPLEQPGKSTAIREQLRGHCELVAVDSRFARYPIEIWGQLVHACTVICTAYPVLSLKYAHDIDVVQPVTDAFIRRWVEPRSQRWAREGLRLYMEPLARLASWDGRSVLWSGPGAG